MIIPSKSEFFRLWELGVLGNRTRLWRDPQEAFIWGRDECNRLGCPIDKPEIGFRELRVGGAGAGSWEKTYWANTLDVADKWKRAGRKFIMDDGAPDQCRTLQGEICRTHRGLEGFLDTVGKLPMRPAMAAGHMLPRTGAAIIALLDKFMDPSSRDDLYDLLDLYQDATIEFSCFGIDVGVFPNRNTLFWEIRNY